MYNPAKDERSIDDALRAIMSGTKRPNREQQDFLEHFTERLKTERREQLSDHINHGSGEPLLDLVHGFPGTGKSAVIAWMRQLMEDGLGWEHGSQFVCLAFQNAMAAQISGHTVHHWSGILVTSDGGPGLGDMHKLSMKCQALRVIIIDEVSMMDAELLGKLREKATKAVRIQKNTYKKRPGHSSRAQQSTRAFGGVNVVMCADFWQLHPVHGTFLASNPECVPGGTLAFKAMEMFWGEAENPDTIRNFWQLTQLMRCDDEWYNNVLTQCRVGNLPMAD